MLRSDDGRYLLLSAGCRYLDRFELREGEWMIADRQLVLDWEREEEEVLGLAGSPMSRGMMRGFASLEDPFGLQGFRNRAAVPAASNVPQRVNV